MIKNASFNSLVFRNLYLSLPMAYRWIAIGGTLDILLTGVILSLGGYEANPIANAILMQYGFAGMVIFKYFVIALVIIGCEIVARHELKSAGRLAVVLIVIHFSPVIWSTGLLVSL